MSNEIKLNDILKIDEESIKNVKIRLMKVPSNDPSNNPLEHYERKPEEVTNDWFLWKYKNAGKPFKVNEIGLGLLNLSGDKWLFVTAQRILEELSNNEGVHYKAEVISEFSKYFGRIVVKYHNRSTMLMRKAINFINELEVLEIRSTQYEGDFFSGYENVFISWKQLHTIIDRQKEDWITALKNQKGIYLITDVKCGKLYVGSAYGVEMILQRWTEYSKNGHGGVKELKKIVKDKGLEYIKNNFQYSILEIYKNNTSSDSILRRESFWKNVLKSREFGYNSN